MSEKSYVEAWRQWKDENPGKYAAAAVLPVSGQLAAIGDFADAMDRGDSTDGAIAAASFIPGIGLANHGSKIAPATLRVGMSKTEKAISPITKRADKIGATADAEQIGETAAKEYNKSRQQASEQEDRDREYMAAWSASS